MNSMVIRDYVNRENCDSASEKKIYYELPKFSGRNVPVKEVARLMGKDQQFIRQGIIKGLLPIGTAFKKNTTNDFNTVESSQYDFYISPKLLWEYTGILYED